MNQPPKNFLRQRIRAFGHAGRGLHILAGKEVHFRIHLVVLILVILTGWWVGLSSTEWLLVLIVSGLVLTAEAINSAVERLCDFVSPEYQLRIKDIKDIAAAAVTLAALTALITGLVIFIPKIILILFS